MATHHLSRPDTPPSHYISAAVLFAFFAVRVCFAVRNSAWLQCLWSSPFLLASAAIFFERSTVIDPQSEAIQREAKLFGKVRLYRKRYPFAVFAEVALRRSPEAETGDTITVGFAGPSKKFLPVRYFKTENRCSSTPAEEFALVLAREAGLPLQAETY